jgi:tight adherence protein B
MLYIMILALGIALLILPRLKRRQRYNYLQEFQQTQFVQSIVSEQQAVNLRSLTEQNMIELWRAAWDQLRKQLGRYPLFKLCTLMIALLLISLELNRRFVQGSAWFVTPFLMCLGFLCFYRWLQHRERRIFEDTFPDALNMMTSAISAGESIMHAILYVGNTLEGDIGDEFKAMGKRLQLGETPEAVFRKSCQRYPYPSFYLFVISLRINIQRGGQLKELMIQLNRIMFNARAMEKKKNALTSEARTSAKIVAAIPFVFLFLLQYISPENYQFVMFNPDGRLILYYVIASEAVGIGIVWGLMKSVTL